MGPVDLGLEMALRDQSGLEVYVAGSGVRGSARGVGAGATPLGSGAGKVHLLLTVAGGLDLGGCLMDLGLEGAMGDLGLGGALTCLGLAGAPADSDKEGIPGGSGPIGALAMWGLRGALGGGATWIQMSGRRHLSFLLLPQL